ncbi:hypothetical protein ACP70R_048019 [Stipagrostis hirtigluma subsp. patula]
MRRPDLMRPKSMKRRRRRVQIPDELIMSRSKRKVSPCQQDSQGSETQMLSGPSLPEDILWHIHSLLPMQDAAQAACACHAFLKSWRCHPNLTFDIKTFGLNVDAHEDHIASEFCIKVDHIMKNRSDVGVKTLDICMPCGRKAKYFRYLNSWLQIAVKPGIEKLSLLLPMEAKYEFPYSLLSNGSGDSIRYLRLADCSFCPTAELGPFRRLTKLYLSSVRITEEGLGCFLSNSLALQRLEIYNCITLVSLKIPCTLQQLGYLEVSGCSRLKLIDSKASTLSVFRYCGCSKIQLSIETLQVKNLSLAFPNAVYYTRVKLPFSMPNLEIVTIYSCSEVSTPVLPSKFLHLRHLIIDLAGFGLSAAYDYLSLVSFLGACPSLETFVLKVKEERMKHISIFADPADLRKMKRQYHQNLKNVKFLGFISAKSMVELACHVVENIKSLECLTLEAGQSDISCSTPGNKLGRCTPVPRNVLVEARRAILAIRTYIVPKVPSTVKLHIVEPCSCHAGEF